MKERGIIFSAPMVRALLAGQKSMTRRRMKPQPSPATAHPKCSPMAGYLGDVHHSIMWYTPKLDGGVYIDRDENSPWRCPYGQPGDRLWVRETWQRDVPGCPGGLSYRADHRDPLGDGPANPMKWRSPLFMPRTASRITLELTDVRVERLHDITDADTLAEGLGHMYRYKGTEPPMDGRWRFEQLWNGLHGDGAWDANPWLWVLSFRRVTP